jgi:hypothetical protein
MNFNHMSVVSLAESRSRQRNQANANANEKAELYSVSSNGNEYGSNAQLVNERSTSPKLFGSSFPWDFKLKRKSSNQPPKQWLN